MVILKFLIRRSQVRILSGSPALTGGFWGFPTRCVGSILARVANKFCPCASDFESRFSYRFVNESPRRGSRSVSHQNICSLLWQREHRKVMSIQFLDRPTRRKYKHLIFDLQIVIGKRELLGLVYIFGWWASTLVISGMSKSISISFWSY